MTGPCIGIRIEDKSILERRAPLTPEDLSLIHIDAADD